jgi:hypothetical protein
VSIVLPIEALAPPIAPTCDDICGHCNREFRLPQIVHVTQDARLGAQLKGRAERSITRSHASATLISDDVTASDGQLMHEFQQLQKQSTRGGMEHLNDEGVANHRNLTVSAIRDGFRRLRLSSGTT